MNDSKSNSFKSSKDSPKPINLTGKLNASLMANTIPPLDVLSIFVNIIPVILVTSLKAFD